MPEIEDQGLFLKGLVADCYKVAQRAGRSLDEVIEYLNQGAHLAALGVFDGIEEDVHYLAVILKRAARLGSLSKK